MANLKDEDGQYLSPLDEIAGFNSDNIEVIFVGCNRGRGCAIFGCPNKYMTESCNRIRWQSYRNDLLISPAAYSGSKLCARREKNSATDQSTGS